MIQTSNAILCWLDRAQICVVIVFEVEVWVELNLLLSCLVCVNVNIQRVKSMCKAMKFQQLDWLAVYVLNDSKKGMFYDAGCFGWSFLHRWILFTAWEWLSIVSWEPCIWKYRIGGAMRLDDVSLDDGFAFCAYVVVMHTLSCSSVL